MPPSSELPGTSRTTGARSTWQFGAVLAIAGNDLRRRLRDRSAIVTAFVAPLVLAALMGIAFGSGGDASLAKVVIVDVENTQVTQAHIDAVLATLDMGRNISIQRSTDGAAAQAAYRSRRASAVITLPVGSSDHLRELSGLDVQVASSRTRPLGKAVGDAFVAAGKLRLATGRATIGALRAEGVTQPDRLFTAVLATLGAKPVLHIDESRVRRESDSPLGYFAPSVAIVFLFISVGFAANSVLSERATGTLARIQAAPVGFGAVVAGKTMSILGLMTLSVFSLWGATALLFHAHWGPPGAVSLLSIATVLAVGAVGLFVTVSARTENGAQSASAAIGFLFAILGGNFFPPGSLPPLLEKAALLTPNGWALNGFTTLALDRGHLGDVIRPIVVLLVMAAVIGGFAITRFRRAVATA